MWKKSKYKINALRGDYYTIASISWTDSKFDACQCHGDPILWAVQPTFKFMHRMSHSGLQCINTCSHKHLAGATPTRCSQQESHSIIVSNLEFTQACYCWRCFFFVVVFLGHQKKIHVQLLNFHAEQNFHLSSVLFSFSWLKFCDFILLLLFELKSHLLPVDFTPKTTGCPGVETLLTFMCMTGTFRLCFLPLIEAT